MASELLSANRRETLDDVASVSRWRARLKGIRGGGALGGSPLTMQTISANLRAGLTEDDSSAALRECRADREQLTSSVVALTTELEAHLDDAPK